MQGRIQPVRLGGTISVTLGAKFITVTVREMKYTPQYYFDKAIEGNMTLYRICCFPNCI